MLVPLLIFLIGLAGTLALVPVFGLQDNRRTHNRAVNLLIGSAILLGYVVGGAAVWWFVPPEWQMSFWETLTASVDAKTYGHPIEHYAECILVLMLFASVAGAMIGGVLAATTARLLKRPGYA